MGDGQDVVMESLGDLYKRIIEADCPEVSDNFRGLLAQLPFVLQGCDTEQFRWVISGTAHSLHFDLETLPFSHMGLLREILEPALLYKKLKDLMDNGGGREGLLRQALDGAVRAELQNYAKFIGVLEAEVRQQLLEQGTLTLQRTLVLLQEATQGLRLLFSLYEQSLDKASGALLSMLHANSYNGDKFVSAFTLRLLEKVAAPFFELLRRWMTTGDLADPYDEFFVRQQDDGSFALEQERVPVFISADMAERIFELGKALYFIRVECGDTEWIEQRRAAADAARSLQADDDSQQNKKRSYRQPGGESLQGYRRLQQTLQDSYDQVAAHLNELLKSKFKLDVHLRALKDYLLLGNGDFAQTLLEEGQAVLSQPAASLYRHALTSMLENVIRASNARDEPLDVLDGLDARMLKSGHGTVGWEIFTLEYRVNGPIERVVLNHASAVKYLQVFNFLWRIRWASFALTATWRRLTMGARGGFGGGMTNKDTAAEWTFVRAVCQKMTHFLREAQYYVNYEVIEMSWVELQRQLGRSNLTVDRIVSAHTKYLDTICDKGLLGRDQALIADFHHIVKGILAFCADVDSLCERSAAGRLDELAANGMRCFDDIYGRIVVAHDDYESRVDALLEALGEHSLAVRLDFNDYYHEKRRQRARSRTPSRTASRQSNPQDMTTLSANASMHDAPDDHPDDH